MVEFLEGTMRRGLPLVIGSLFLLGAFVFLAGCATTTAKIALSTDNQDAMIYADGVLVGKGSGVYDTQRGVYDYARSIEVQVKAPTQQPVTQTIHNEFDFPHAAWDGALYLAVALFEFFVEPNSNLTQDPALTQTLNNISYGFGLADLGLGVLSVMQSYKFRPGYTIDVPAQ